jgi:hypothetical protein
MHILLASLFVCGSLTGQSKPSSNKIGASSVWQLPAQFMTTAHAACDRRPGSNYADCMIGQMTKAGAPADAAQFTRELYEQSHREFGVMTGFQNEGLVDFAWVTYPSRANTNYGLLLLMGSRASSTLKTSSCLTSEQ